MESDARFFFGCGEGDLWGDGAAEVRGLGVCSSSETWAGKNDPLTAITATPTISQARQRITRATVPVKNRASSKERAAITRVASVRNTDRKFLALLQELSCNPQPTRDPVNYFIYQSGETFGPYQIDQLSAIWCEGRVAGNALFYEEGAAEWKDISELRPRLEPPATLKPTSVSAQSSTQAVGASQRRRRRMQFVVGGLAAVILTAVTAAIALRSSKARREIASHAAVAQDAARLIIAAESSLRGSDFARCAELLNQVSTEYPDTRQARVVQELAAFLRAGQTNGERPFSPTEALRVRSAMDALQKIKADYHGAAPEKRHALEAVFGAEVLEAKDIGLDALSVSATKLRDYTEKAR